MTINNFEQEVNNTKEPTPLKSLIIDDTLKSLNLQQTLVELGMDNDHARKKSSKITSKKITSNKTAHQLISNTDDSDLRNTSNKIYRCSNSIDIDGNKLIARYLCGDRFCFSCEARKQVKARKSFEKVMCALIKTGQKFNAYTLTLNIGPAVHPSKTRSRIKNLSSTFNRFLKRKIFDNQSGYTRKIEVSETPDQLINAHIHAIIIVDEQLEIDDIIRNWKDTVDGIDKKNVHAHISHTGNNKTGEIIDKLAGWTCYFSKPITHPKNNIITDSVLQTLVKQLKSLRLLSSGGLFKQLLKEQKDKLKKPKVKKKNKKPIVKEQIDVAMVHLEFDTYNKNYMYEGEIAIGDPKNNWSNTNIIDKDLFNKIDDLPFSKIDSQVIIPDDHLNEVDKMIDEDKWIKSEYDVINSSDEVDSQRIENYERILEDWKLKNERILDSIRDRDHLKMLETNPNNDKYLRYFDGLLSIIICKVAKSPKLIWKYKKWIEEIKEDVLLDNSSKKRVGKKQAVQEGTVIEETKVDLFTKEKMTNLDLEIIPF